MDRYDHYKDDLKVLGSNAEEMIHQVIATCVWVYKYYHLTRHMEHPYIPYLLWSPMPMVEHWRMPTRHLGRCDDYHAEIKKNWRYLVISSSRHPLTFNQSTQYIKHKVTGTHKYLQLSLYLKQIKYIKVLLTVDRFPTVRLIWLPEPTCPSQPTRMGTVTSSKHPRIPPLAVKSSNRIFFLYALH